MRFGVFVFGCLLASSAATAVADGEPRRTQRVLEVGIHEGVPWPLMNAPIDGPLPDAPVPELADPATRAGVKVLGLLESIRATTTDDKYQASTKVDVKRGIYYWDCSGMASWILRRAAPAAQRALASERPVARDFAAAIERAPTKRAKAGWQRIANIADVLPGDVFAWRRPKGMPSKNTGHVGFVVGKPQPVPMIPGAWAVPIADSTRGIHQNDSRGDGDGEGGLGFGTLTFLTDSTGAVTAYGWSGTWSEWYVVTKVVFGRVSS
jgi:hypothetical protein